MSTMEKYLEKALKDKRGLNEMSDGEKFGNEMDDLYSSVGKDTKKIESLISNMKKSKFADKGLVSKTEAKFNAFKQNKEALFGLMDEVNMDIE